MRITEEREHGTNMSDRSTRFINVQVDLSKIARLVGALAIEVTKESVKDILSRKWIEEKDVFYGRYDSKDSIFEASPCREQNWRYPRGKDTGLQFADAHAPIEDR